MMLIEAASSIYCVFCGDSLNFPLYPPSNGNGFSFPGIRDTSIMFCRPSFFNAAKTFADETKHIATCISLLVDKVSFMCYEHDS